MIEIAIKILQKDSKGFFLFVEGGKIDMAHHYNQARRALDETLEFDKAIEVAATLTSEEDTLMVVTADHSHTMSMNGYPARGFDILGIYGQSDRGIPYPTLSYANGPSYKKEIAPGIPYDIRNDNLSKLYTSEHKVVSKIFIELLFNFKVNQVIDTQPWYIFLWKPTEEMMWLYLHEVLGLIYSPEITNKVIYRLPKRTLPIFQYLAKFHRILTRVHLGKILR